MHKVIAVCGKGGVGKTALTAMVTREMKKRADVGRLLVVDADPALGLLYALNVETDKTIGAVRDKVLEAAESGDAGSQAEVANELDYLITSTLKEEDGYSVIAMGRMNAKGCFCSVNDLLKDALEELVDKFDTIVIDGEAGLEQIDRQVVERINTLVLVTDSSFRGIQTVHHIEELVKNGAAPDCSLIGVVFNRIQGDERTLEELQALVHLPVLGIVPYDATLQTFDAQGRCPTTRRHSWLSTLWSKNSWPEHSLLFFSSNRPGAHALRAFFCTRRIRACIPSPPDSGLSSGLVFAPKTFLFTFLCPPATPVQAVRPSDGKPKSI